MKVEDRGSVIFLLLAQTMHLFLRTCVSPPTHDAAYFYHAWLIFFYFNGLLLQSKFTSNYTTTKLTINFLQWTMKLCFERGRWRKLKYLSSFLIATFFIVQKFPLLVVRCDLLGNFSWQPGWSQANFAFMLWLSVWWMDDSWILPEGFVSVNPSRRIR